MKTPAETLVEEWAKAWHPDYVMPKTKAAPKPTLKRKAVILKFKRKDRR